MLKQVHPGCSLSTDAKTFLNQLIVNFLNRMCLFLATITEHGRRVTVTGREVQTATRLFFKDELRKHAVSEGTNAVTKYTSFVKKGKKQTSQADKAHLTLPPPRFRSFISVCIPDYKSDIRLSDTAIIYLTAVSEYLVAELLELAGNIVRREDKNRITVDALKHVIETDNEIAKTLCHL